MVGYIFVAIEVNFLSSIIKQVFVTDFSPTVYRKCLKIVTHHLYRHAIP